MVLKSNDNVAGRRTRPRASPAWRRTRPPHLTAKHSASHDHEKWRAWFYESWSSASGPLARESSAIIITRCSFEFFQIPSANIQFHFFFLLERKWAANGRRRATISDNSVGTHAKFYPPSPLCADQFETSTSPPPPPPPGQTPGI